MPLVLPIVLCIASGYLIVTSGWSRPASGFEDPLLRTSLSVGCGLGVFSAVFFLVRAFSIAHMLVADVCVLAVLAVAFFVIPTRATENDLPTPKENFATPPWLHRTLIASFAIALCAALYSAVLRILAHPNGDGWDAFAIWNLHARFLFLGGDHWRDGFSALIPWSHPDYPLLLPGAVAHFWSYLGHDDPDVPAAIGLVFAVCTVGLLFSSLDLLRGRTTALLGGLTLLSTPFFIEQGTSQYADVPLSFFMLAAIALPFLYNHRSSHSSVSRPRGLLVLAGLAGGFAAWTKNEGLLFLCAMVAARILILIRPLQLRAGPNQESPHGVATEGSSKNWRPLVTLLLGITPVFVLIVWFKHSFAPAGDLFSSPATMLHRVLTPSRYWAIIKWYAKDFLLFGNWSFVPGTLLLAFFYFMTRTKKIAPREPSFRASAWTLVLTLAGYFAIYLITPYDLYWHLRFSLSRLFLQLWPCTIFCFFLAVPLRNPSGVSK